MLRRKTVAEHSALLTSKNEANSGDTAKSSREMKTVSREIETIFPLFGSDSGISFGN
jgi:pyridoxal biosynthesis lyase PdxS